ncbi:hypothetical protein ACFL6L_04475 [candidate division KSB1 bacterium]
MLHWIKEITVYIKGTRIIVSNNSSSRCIKGYLSAHRIIFWITALTLLTAGSIILLFTIRDHFAHKEKLVKNTYKSISLLNTSLREQIEYIQDSQFRLKPLIDQKVQKNGEQTVLEKAISAGGK